MKPETNLPVTFCPYCGTRLDAATPALGKGITPSPGDASLCLRCSAWLVFDGDLRPRKPTDAENRVFARDQKMRRVQRVARKFILEKLFQQ